MIQVPDLRWVVRIAWAIAGAAWFLWLAHEDRNLGAVMALSGVVCLALSMTVVARWRGGRQTERRSWLLESMVLGMLAGALVPPVAALLILVKVSLHAHGTPDFTADDLAAVLDRLPVWALAGVLWGEAMGLLAAIFSPVK